MKNHSVSHFDAVSGRGVYAKVAGKAMVLGNKQWMLDHDVVIDQACEEQIRDYAEQGATPVLMALDQVLQAVFSIADPIKTDSKDAIDALHKLGIKTAVISGDNQATVDAIARQVGIDMVFAEVKPEEKAAYVKQLQAKGERVGMVGDGINDAPALSQANVGFSIGSGTDVAIESADITLARDSLLGVQLAIRLSKATMRTIRNSLIGAFAYNCIGLLIAAGVFYPLWHVLLSPIVASAAMAASSVTVVLVASSLRKTAI